MSQEQPEEYPAGSMGTIHKIFSKGRKLVPLEKRNMFFIYMLIVNSAFLDALNTSSMLTSLINIQKKFDSNYATVSWVISSYAITLSGFIMLFGRIGDIVGHHIVFLVGISGFCILSLICAVIEKQIIVLLVFRALQGVCASASFPSSFALIAFYFTGSTLSNAITGLTVGMNTCIGIGIVLGGAFSETQVGYKAFFYLSFGLSSISAIFGFFYIIPVSKSKVTGNLKNLNFIGGVLLVTGFILIVLGLTEGGVSWKSPKTYVPLPVGILLVALVLVWERYYLHPYQVSFRREQDLEGKTGLAKSNWRSSVDLLVPADAWKVPNIILLISTSFFNYANFFGTVVSLVQYFAYVEGNSPLLAAVKILPLTVTLVIGCLVYRDSHAEKIGKKWVAAFGFAIGLGGNILLSRINYEDENNYWKFILPGQIMYAFGSNMFFILFMNLLIGNTPLHLQGIISGIGQAFSQTGIAVILGAVASLLGNLDSDSARIMLHERFRHCFYLLIGLGGAQLILVLFLKGNKGKDTDLSVK